MCELCISSAVSKWAEPGPICKNGQKEDLCRRGAFYSGDGDDGGVSDDRRSPGGGDINAWSHITRHAARWWVMMQQASAESTWLRRNQENDNQQGDSRQNQKENVKGEGLEIKGEEE